MKVDVKNRLAGVGIAVEHGSITAVREPLILGDGSGCTHHFANQRVVVGAELIQTARCGAGAR